MLRVVPQPECAEELAGVGSNPSWSRGGLPLQAVTETGSITCGQNVWVEKVVGALVKADPVAGSDQAT